MPKFCIYNTQLDLIKHALTNGGNYEKQKALETISDVETSYAIIGISKGDVAEQLFGNHRLDSSVYDTGDIAERITDDEIENLAEDMGSIYLDNEYWSDIGNLGEHIKTRIEQELSEERDANRSD